MDKALIDVKVLRRDMEGESKRLADKQAVAEREANATRNAPGTAPADAQANLEKVPISPLSPDPFSFALFQRRKALHAQGHAHNS